ncbi:MAG: carboxypeptidase regulatory-like domain-containing protein, partial [Candidatus Thermoplasmatota archaeon]|nr:carboxypeptidase regulatory-like domain-containing protein [Candidatus Thermoplasmatota archaeon]
DGSLSSDNNGIASYTWTVEYDWGNQTIKGEVVEFIFPNAGTYVVVLTVVDASANAAFDNFTITVIDTGIVKGIVLDENGDPVEGAGVEITASDAGRYDVTTGSDGTFFIEIPHGAFSWRISKEGYRTIIGKGTVSAMDETNLDLEETPMRREEGPVSILFVVLPILLLILLIVGVSILFFLGKRKAD